MLAISRALLLRPRLLLLDEPSFGLSPRLVDELFDVLGQIRANERVAMLVVEQNARVALALADTALLLESGRIAAAGSAAAMLDDPRIQRAYLGD
jgi:branched-chain amino acid transport system ATP-binding protein